MKRYALGLFFASVALLIFAAPSRSQETGDCAKHGLAQEVCQAWRSAVRAEALSLILKQLDAHIGRLVSSGEIAQEKGAQQKARLAASQSAWETYRNLQCTLPGAHPRGADVCPQVMTEARLGELQDPDVAEPGQEDKSWSERRVLESPFHRSAWIMLRLGIQPMRTIADRVALTTGPRETREWSFRKQVFDFAPKIRQVAGFGPLTSAFIAAEWDMLRYDPETGTALHQAPGKIEGSPADNSWDKHEAEAFAARLPACMRNLADPKCRVRYSTELGCRYDEDMARFCQARMDGLREVFQFYSVDNPQHREQFYRAIACLTPVPFDERFSGSFLTSGFQAKGAASMTAVEGLPCSAIGLTRDGEGWSARQVQVFGVAIDLEMR